MYLLIQSCLAKSLKVSALLICALMISYGIFLYMYSFIIQKNIEVNSQETFVVSSIDLPVQQPEKIQQIENEEEVIQEMPPTPSLALQLTIETKDIPSLSPSKMTLPTTMDAFKLSPAATSNSFSLHSAEGIDGLSDKKTTGKRIFPASSVQPDIPELAWVNRINGWVEVSISINEKGRVTNVTVLDAMPKGVFEESVIRSVEHWLYPPFKHEGKAVPIKLLQKIELFWKDYAYNDKS